MAHVRVLLLGRRDLRSLLSRHLQSGQLSSLLAWTAAYHHDASRPISLVAPAPDRDAHPRRRTRALVALTCRCRALSLQRAAAFVTIAGASGRRGCPDGRGAAACRRPTGREPPGYEEQGEHTSGRDALQFPRCCLHTACFPSFCSHVALATVATRLPSTRGCRLGIKCACHPGPSPPTMPTSTPTITRTKIGEFLCVL